MHAFKILPKYNCRWTNFFLEKISSTWNENVEDIDADDDDDDLWLQIFSQYPKPNI